jgi:hypothetical protein|tara:strand:+ start:918 stop:1148 length:231 start_codon:yes stop_codon:yes gene_type:complete
MKTKRQEAVLLGYKLLYDRSGKLVTERISTDINELKKYMTQTDYSTLEVVMRDCTAKLDQIHSYIESNLDARKMTE